MSEQAFGSDDDQVKASIVIWDDPIASAVAQAVARRKARRTCALFDDLDRKWRLVRRVFGVAPSRIASGRGDCPASRHGLHHRIPAARRPRPRRRVAGRLRRASASDRDPGSDPRGPSRGGHVAGVRSPELSTRRPIGSQVRDWLLVQPARASRRGSL